MVGYKVNEIDSFVYLCSNKNELGFARTDEDIKIMGNGESS